MKPFPTSGGGGGLNVSLHLILLTLAIIAGFFVMFRELRRVEMDLHDNIARSTAPFASSAAAAAAASSKWQTAMPVFRFDNVPIPPPHAQQACNVGQYFDMNDVDPLPPVPEESAEVVVVEKENTVVEKPADDVVVEKTENDHDALSGLSDNQLMARPAAELREHLRRRDASTTGNKQELVMRIIAEKKLGG